MKIKTEEEKKQLMDEFRAGVSEERRIEILELVREWKIQQVEI